MEKLPQKNDRVIEWVRSIHVGLPPPGQIDDDISTLEIEQSDDSSNTDDDENGNEVAQHHLPPARVAAGAAADLGHDDSDIEIIEEFLNQGHYNRENNTAGVHGQGSGSGNNSAAAAGVNNKRKNLDEDEDSSSSSALVILEQKNPNANGNKKIRFEDIASETSSSEQGIAPVVAPSPSDPSEHTTPMSTGAVDAAEEAEGQPDSDPDQVVQDTEERMLAGNPQISYPKRCYQNKGYDANGTQRERKMFKCWYCPWLSYDTDAYQAHKRKHLISSEFKCESCTFSSEKLQFLQLHSVCHTEKYYDVNFKTRAAFRTKQHKSSSSRSRGKGRRAQPSVPRGRRRRRPHHHRTFQPMNRFAKKKTLLRCIDKDCPMVFLFNSLRQRHAKSHSMVYRSKFRCNLCTFSISNMNGIQAHLAQHKAGSDQYRVGAVAGAGTASASSPSSGKAAAAANYISPLEIRRQKKSQYKFACTECPAKFPKSRLLFNHLERHRTPGSVHKCSVCSYGVNAAWLLERHQLLHGGGTLTTSNSVIKPGSSGRRQGGLHHNNNNNKRKPYTGKMHKCKDLKCPQTFCYDLNRERHYKDKHCGTGSFKCSLCTYSSNKDRTYRSHLSQHRTKGERVGLTAPPRQQVFSGKRSRINPVHAGLITAEEMEQIRIGNPIFEYATRKQVKGREIASSYRCMLCPASFCHFLDWRKHQAGIHGNLAYSTKILDCEQCEYQTDNLTKFRSHCRQHRLTSATKTKTGQQQHGSKVQVQVEGGSRRVKQETDLTDSSEDAEVEQGSSQEEMEVESVYVKPAQLDSSDTNISLVSHEPQPGKPAAAASFIRRDTQDTEFSNIPPKCEPVDSDSLWNGGDREQKAEGQLIMRLTLKNFMNLQKKTMNAQPGLNKLRGEGQVGKTSTIIGCLFGIGYDLLLDLPPNGRICGVDFGTLVWEGQPEAFSEVTLRLDSSPALVQMYGKQLILRRRLEQGANPTTESRLEIMYPCQDAPDSMITEEINKEELKTIMSHLIPEFLLRFLVLNEENVQYLAENFDECQDIFWKLMDRKKSQFTSRVENLMTTIKSVGEDLMCRQLRISLLRQDISVVDVDCDRESESESLDDVQQFHFFELGEIIGKSNVIRENYDTIIEENSNRCTTWDNHVQLLVDRMGRTFKEFLSSQSGSYTGQQGDLLFGDRDQEVLGGGGVGRDQELIIWIKDSRVETSQGQATQEEARLTWKELTVANKRLAILGLLLALWDTDVMDCCPVLFADFYSSTPDETERELSSTATALPMLLKMLEQSNVNSKRQIFCSCSVPT